MNCISMVYYGNKITYGDFFRNVELISKCLVAHGVSEGDIVSIISLNTPETTYLLYAISNIGAVANMLIATCSTKEIEESIKNTNSKLIFVLDKILEKSELYLVSIPIVVLPMGLSAKGMAGMQTHTFLRNFHEYISYKQFIMKSKDYVATNKPDLPVIIEYTSGTTGIPKGVVLNNRNINSVAYMCFSSGKEYKEGEKFLNVLPPFFSFGIGMMHSIFYAGMTEVIELVPKTKHIVRMLKKHRPERITFGPVLYDVIEKNSQKDMSYLVDLCAGGGAIHPDKEKKINEILEKKKAKSVYLAGYGMTELSSAVSTNCNDYFKLQSIGIPLPMVNMKIVSVETGKELSYDEEGELLVFSPGLMQGYYKNEAATREVIEIIDGERWIHTGDLAKIDTDGFVYITGRIKRIYITTDEAGTAYKLFPQRLEETIEEYEGVNKCAVVVIPDDKRQNVAVAFVDAKEIIEIDALEKYIQNELPSYYYPVKIVNVDKMPINSNQKIDYRTLEKKAYSLLEI